MPRGIARFVGRISAQFLEAFAFASYWIFLCVLVRKIPVLLNADATVLEGQVMSGRQLVHVLKDRQRIGDVAKRKVSIECFYADLAAELRMLAQGFQLRSEDQYAARRDREIQRLLAHAIARDENLAGAGVPQGKGKHAAQMVDTARAELFVSMNNRFGVGMSLESMTPRFEFALQVAIVVNLAVEDHRDRAVAAGHRLVPARQIDN